MNGFVISKSRVSGTSRRVVLCDVVIGRFADPAFALLEVFGVIQIAHVGQDAVVVALVFGARPFPRASAAFRRVSRRGACRSPGSDGPVHRAVWRIASATSPTVEAGAFWTKMSPLRAVLEGVQHQFHRRSSSDIMNRVMAGSVMVIGTPAADLLDEQRDDRSARRHHVAIARAAHHRVAFHRAAATWRP